MIRLKYFISLFIFFSCSTQEVKNVQLDCSANYDQNFFKQNFISLAPTKNIKHGLRKPVLLIPGLNLRPEKMILLAKNLAKDNHPAYILKLYGNRGNFEELENLTRFKWLNQVNDSICALKLKHDKNKIFVLGYSLGGLVTADYLEHTNRAHESIDKIAFISPALSLKWYSNFIKLLFIFGRKIKLKSFSDKSYRLYDSLPMNVYHELFASYQAVDDYKMLKDIPGRIWMHPKDELVSFQGTQEILTDHSFYNWELRAVHSTTDHFKHLIIDENSMGKRNFDLMMGQIIDFFKN